MKADHSSKKSQMLKKHEDRYDQALHAIGDEMQIALDTHATRAKHGSQRVGKYVKGSFLGRGGFAEVHQFQDVKTGKIYAGKAIDK